ncbi:Subtilisin inhibitor-like [Amycolatopsis marina]|uniref:Subtilisin inhibitor-like n=1 Tax=Amycolatopsis marina TaxID=490629 RepID=A0A1I0ZU63_9PSEU|nr:SSI family serine proteinase inhibitor [Amycolatopsis marina]SFB27970.1 Subtilisin inhibitor-like [Amycolatopsis marina]
MTPADSALTLTTHDVNGSAKSVVLHCDPATGNHPSPAEACDALADADGDFEDLETQEVACALIYSPVQATAHGHWRGDPVVFETVYPNACVAGAESSGVFGF